VALDTQTTPLDVLAILMPIYNDWESAVQLVGAIEHTLSTRAKTLRFVLIDDESKLPPPHTLSVASPTTSVEILRLRRNLGHQRAIAIGLMHLLPQTDITAVIVMDGDGEDTPEGTRILVDRFNLAGRNTAIFAQRARRTENLIFKLFYFLFRTSHRLFIGTDVRVGNFSILPRSHLSCLAVVPELWNHFAAAVFKSRLRIEQVPIDRGYRFTGSSHMNFIALVAHGLSAISVFSDIVGLRLLIASTLFAVTAALGLFAVSAMRLTTTLAIPGWATTATGFLLIVLLQALLLVFVFVFIVLHGRNTIGFLPVRDYLYFIERTERIDTH